MELGIADTKMTFLAYLTLSVALLSLLGHETRSWLRRAGPQRELAVRMGALAAGVFSVVSAVLLVEGESGVELALLALLAVGGGVFLLGVILWRGGTALALRAIGWALAVTALAAPSLLTLALPAAALLIVTLGPAPEQPPRSTAQPARS
jgi:hypothetical protein